jgi:hypothetical protein
MSKQQHTIVESIDVGDNNWVRNLLINNLIIYPLITNPLHRRNIEPISIPADGVIISFDDYGQVVLDFKSASAESLARLKHISVNLKTG